MAGTLSALLCHGRKNDDRQPRKVRLGREDGVELQRSSRGPVVSGGISPFWQCVADHDVSGLFQRCHGDAWVAADGGA